MTKQYVLDTNVLLNRLEIVEEILERGDKVIIPLPVLEELDKMKGRGHNEERKFKARVIIRKLAEHEKEIKMVSELSDESLEIAKTYKFDMDYQDTKILALTVLRFGDNTTLLTMDVAMRLKARALGINVELVEDLNTNKDYSGKLTVESNSMASMRFQSNGFVLPEDLGLNEEDLYPNQFVKMKTFSGYEIGRYIKSEGKIKRIVHRSTEVYNIKARNIDQQMALDVLLDPNIKVLTISGRAGTGKTIEALAYALEEMKFKRYDRLLLGKNTAPVDKWSYQGFTKGETTDKILSHFGNYTSNLEFLTKCNYKNGNVDVDGKKELARLMEEGMIDVLDIASILGRSIDNKLVIIDEAQSFDIQAIKSIITRITDNSKLIIIGDLKQETVNKLQNGNKGFQEIINALKDCETVAHVTLKQIERGKVQQEIAEALGL